MCYSDAFKGFNVNENEEVITLLIHISFYSIPNLSDMYASLQHTGQNIFVLSNQIYPP